MYLSNSHVENSANETADDQLNNCRGAETTCDEGEEVSKPETRSVTLNGPNGSANRYFFQSYQNQDQENSGRSSAVGGVGGGDCQDFYDFFPSFNQSSADHCQQQPTIVVSNSMIDPSNAPIKEEPEEEKDPLIDHTYSFIKSDQTSPLQSNGEVDKVDGLDKAQIEDLDNGQDQNVPLCEYGARNHELSQHLAVYNNDNDNQDIDDGQHRNGPDDGQYEPILSNGNLQLMQDYHLQHSQPHPSHLRHHHSHHQQSFENEMHLGYAYSMMTPVNYNGHQEAYSPGPEGAPPMGYANQDYLVSLHHPQSAYSFHPHSNNLPFSPMQPPPPPQQVLCSGQPSQHQKYGMDDSHGIDSRFSAIQQYTFMADGSGDNGRLEIKSEAMSCSDSMVLIKSGPNNNNDDHSDPNESQPHYTIASNELARNCIDNHSESSFLDHEPEEPYYEQNEPSPNQLSIDEMQQINSKYTHQRFPIKLWNLASDASFPSIKWSSDGQSLIIDEYTLEPSLGYFFRSKKFSSFLRQLHLYGFRKVTRARNHRSSTAIRIGEEKIRSDYISEYQCNFFQRDRFELVKKVRRFYNNQAPQAAQPSPMMLLDSSPLVPKLSSPSSSSNSSQSISPVLQRSSSLFIHQNSSSSGTFILQHQNGISSGIDSSGDGGQQQQQQHCYGQQNNILDGGDYYDFQHPMQQQQQQLHGQMNQLLTPKIQPSENSPPHDNNNTDMVRTYCINDNCVDISYCYSHNPDQSSCSLTHGHGNPGNGSFSQSLMAPRSYA